MRSMWVSLSVDKDFIVKELLNPNKFLGYKLPTNFFKWQKICSLVEIILYKIAICIQLCTTSQPRNNLETRSTVNIKNHWSSANHTWSLLFTHVTDGSLRMCNLNTLFLAEIWIPVVEIYCNKQGKKWKLLSWLLQDLCLVQKAC